MGRWGPGLFDDDIALDVVRDFEQALEDDLDVFEAAHQIIAHPPWDLEDDDTGPIIYLALAALQLEYGVIQPEIRDRALGILNTGAGLEVWEEAGGLSLIERRQVLEQFRQVIVAFPEQQKGVQQALPQRQPRRRPPEQLLTSGDFVSIPLPGGRLGFGRALPYNLFGVYDVVNEQPLAISTLRSRPFLFRAFFYEDVLTSGRWSIIGHAELTTAEVQEAEKPLRNSVYNTIFVKGQWRKTTPDEGVDFEEGRTYDAESIERHLVSVLLEDRSARSKAMADFERLRILVTAALQREASQEHSEPHRELVHRNERMIKFRERLEQALSSEFREALGLVYEWDEWSQQPRAFFRIKSIAGNADCTIHFNDIQLTWIVFIPNAYHPTQTFESPNMEQGILLAIGDFWKRQRVLSSSEFNEAQGAP